MRLEADLDQELRRRGGVPLGRGPLVGRLDPREGKAEQRDGGRAEQGERAHEPGAGNPQAPHDLGGIARAGTALYPLGWGVPLAAGTFFWGSMNGSTAVVPVREPSSVSISSRLPGSASPIGTHT